MRFFFERFVFFSSNFNFFSLSFDTTHSLLYINIHMYSCARVCKLIQMNFYLVKCQIIIVSFNVGTNPTADFDISDDNYYVYIIDVTHTKIVKTHDAMCFAARFQNEQATRHTKKTRRRKKNTSFSLSSVAKPQAHSKCQILSH